MVELKLRLLVSLLYLSYSVHGEPIETKNRMSNVETEILTNYSRSKRWGNRNSIRIHVEYMNSFKSLPNARRIKERVVEQAVNRFVGLVSVRNPVVGRLRLARECSGPTGAGLVNGRLTHYCMNGCQRKTFCVYTTVPYNLLDNCYQRGPGGNIVKSGTMGEGVAADIIMFVEANHPTCGSDVNAMSSYCDRDPTLDRPISGAIIICPNLKFSTEQELDYTTETLTHEMIHVLAFAKAHYHFYRDASGNPYSPRDQSGMPIQAESKDSVPTKVIRHQWRDWQSALSYKQVKVPVMVLPNVAHQAREHFGCPSLIGMDLEADGSAGTAMSHWEQRIAFDEILAGTHVKRNYFSKITLAIFADSGWYYVDWSKADDWKFARNIGCDFIYNSCYTFMQKRKREGLSVQPYCDVLTEFDRGRCMVYENAVGMCNMRKMSKLEPNEIHFHNLRGIKKEDLPYYGGRNGFATHCPMIESFENSEYKDISGYCEDETNIDYYNKMGDRRMQYYGKNSLCVEHASVWTGSNCRSHQRYAKGNPTCHKYRCDPHKGLILIMGKIEFVCPVNGGEIDVSSYHIEHGLFLQARAKCVPCYIHCKNCPAVNAVISTAVKRWPCGKQDNGKNSFSNEHYVDWDD